MKQIRHASVFVFFVPHGALLFFILLFLLFAEGSAVRAQQIDPTRTVDPKLADILVRGGQALKNDNLNGARLLFGESLALDSNNLEALRNYAVSLSRLGRKIEAIDWINRAIRNAPKNAELYNILGVTCSDLGRRPQAIAAYREAIARDSLNSLYHTNLGSEYAKSGDYTAGLRALRVAQRLDTINTEILFWIANVFASQKKFDSAAIYYQECLDRGQRICEVYHFLSVAQRNVGRVADAEKTLLAAIKTDTTCAPCFSDLGISYARQQKFVAAQVHLEKAVRLNARNYDAWIALGTSYYMTSMFAQADTVVWRLKQVDTTYVNRMLALIELEVQRKEKAASPNNTPR